MTRLPNRSINWTKLPVLFRKELARSSRLARLGETWRCTNVFCGVWVQPSRTRLVGVCHQCGTARPIDKAA